MNLIMKMIKITANVVAIIALQTFWCSVQGRRQKNFQDGPMRIEPVVTTKNGRIFVVWEVKERLCKNQGGAWPPAPPLPTPMLTD